MRLNPKALAFAAGLIWAAAVFFAGVAHTIWPGYAGAFLDVVASIYPGFHVGGIGATIVGTLYALIDGAVWGLIVAWIYNAVSAPARTGTAPIS
ncbi:MAG: hypothetical protein ACREL5_02685 [Gemmatimonadales bacterium]